VRLSVFFFALSCAIAAAEGARADDRTTFAQLNDEGAAFYRARDFKKAIESFQKAYAIEPDPNLIFDIARCEQALGEDAAIGDYERFLAAEGGDRQARSKAEEQLAALKKHDPRRPSYVVPAIAFLGAGAVAATVGTIMYLGGVSDHKAVEGAANYGTSDKVYGLTRADAQGLVDSGDKKKLAGGIVMGVAGALLVTGIVFVVLDRRAAITLAPVQGGAFASATGRF
jgi:tetratricopeptide (TPR) repeat protein